MEAAVHVKLGEGERGRIKHDKGVTGVYAR